MGKFKIISHLFLFLAFSNKKRNDEMLQVDKIAAAGRAEQNRQGALLVVASFTGENYFRLIEAIRRVFRVFTCS